MSQQQQQGDNFDANLAGLQSRLSKVEDKLGDVTVIGAFVSQGYHTAENLEAIKFLKDNGLSVQELREIFAQSGPFPPPPNPPAEDAAAEGAKDDEKAKARIS